MGREEREHKRAGETGRECEEMTDTKRDGGKEIEREWKERMERDEAREGERDQSVACTRSISTCSHKLYKSLFSILHYLALCVANSFFCITRPKSICVCVCVCVCMRVCVCFRVESFEVYV